MLRVRPIEARPGMRLAMPVYHPRHPGTLLLQPGLALEAKAIARLRELKVHEVWIECPKLREMGGTVSPQVQAARADVTSHIAEVFDKAASQTKVELDYTLFRHTIGSLLTKLAEGPKTNLFVAELAAAGFPAIRHATDVAFLSVLIGLKLDFYLLRERPKLSPAQAKDVTNLGVAAMLHDIGMTRLPQPVLERWNTTLDESDPAWREHVRLGYEMVSGQIEPTAAAAVLHHHQRYDGSGFPLKPGHDALTGRVSGRDIHIFARIIGAAEQFDRLVHPASAPGSDLHDLPSRPVVRALRMLQSPPYSGWVDPIVLSGLLAVCPPYPPGTLVRLSNGMRCAVANWDPMQPCRPTVIEVGEDDPTAEGEPGERIELAERPDLEVVEAEGQDVQADNWSIGHGERVDLGTLQREIELDARVLPGQGPRAA